MRFWLPLLVFSGVVISTSAANWPQFRGPNGSGVAEGAKPPIHFGLHSNLLWKTAIPSGVSSAAVWNDQLFITAFDNGKLETITLDGKNGKILWRKSAPEGKVDEVHPSSNPASATPATDGERVYSYLASYGLVAHDLKGVEKWRQPVKIGFVLNGSGTSPSLAEGRLILNADQQNGQSFLAAYDCKTGKQLWETPRPDFNSGYSTPIVWDRPGRKEIILPGSIRVVAYDLTSGKENWSVRGFEAVSVAPSPVLGDGLLFVMSRSFGGNNLPPFSSMLSEMDKNADQKIARTEVKGMLAGKGMLEMIDSNKNELIEESEWDATRAALGKGDYGLLAIRPPDKGDATQTHLVWKQKKGAAVVPSPLFYQGRIYVVQDGGRVSCYESKTGRPHYEQERLKADGEYYASPVAANGKIFLCSTRGRISVLEDGESFKLAAQTDLGEAIMATPALVGNRIYIRSASHLWAFGE